MYITVPLLPNSELGRNIDEETPFGVINAGYTEITSDDIGTYRPNGFGNYQLLYIQSGTVIFTIDGKTVPLSAKTAVIFHPGEPQIYTYPHGEHPKTYWLHIGGSAVEGFLKKLNLFEQHIFPVIDDNMLTDSICSAVDEMISQRNGYDYAAISYAMQACLCLSRNEDSKFKNSLQNAVEQIKIKIRHDYKTDVSNAEYAAEYNMSVSYFMHLFKQLTGTTPQKYKLQLRLETAQHMLISSTLPIGEIATQVGFNSAMYFCRYFNKKIGMSPSQYRKKYK